jgi:hypothetical protein
MPEAEAIITLPALLTTCFQRAACHRRTVCGCLLFAQVKFGAVDCTVHQSTCGQYGVRGYPTIKVFGSNKESPSDYQGGRDSGSIVAEANKAWASNAKPREVRSRLGVPARGALGLLRSWGWSNKSNSWPDLLVSACQQYSCMLNRQSTDDLLTSRVL